jgi:hypothetical protein
MNSSTKSNDGVSHVWKIPVCGKSPSDTLSFPSEKSDESDESDKFDIEKTLRTLKKESKKKADKKIAITLGIHSLENGAKTFSISRNK